VLFLRTDLPYEWSKKEQWYVSPGRERPDWMTRLMVRIGMVPRCPIAEQANHIYPFRRQSSLDEARATLVIRQHHDLPARWAGAVSASNAAANCRSIPAL
jgi:hypothetical protein